MAENTSEQVSSLVCGSRVHKTSTRKRKKAAQQSPDCPRIKSIKPTAASTRPKRACTAPPAPQQSQPAAESPPPKDEAKLVHSPIPENCSTSLPKPPSPEMGRARATPKPRTQQSPARHLDNDRAGPASGTPELPVPDTSSRQAAQGGGASTANVYQSSEKPEPRRLAKSMAHLASHTIESSAPMFFGMRRSAECPDPATFGPRRETLFPSGSSSSPLASYPRRPSTLSSSVVFQQAEAVKYQQQSMAKLQRDAQAYQQVPIAANIQQVTLQDQANLDDLNRAFFIHGETTFTLRECILACALKSFCKHTGKYHAGEVISDDTIAEVLQFQRGWRDPNGLYCQGLYQSLMQERTAPRAQIHASITADVEGWQKYARSSYQTWMQAMQRMMPNVVVDRHRQIATAEAVQMSAAQGTPIPNANAYLQHRQEQLTSAVAGWAPQIASYAPSIGPMPGVQITAPVSNSFEQLPSNQAGPQQNTTTNEWVGGSGMQTTNFNFNTVPEGDDVFQSGGVGLDEGYLPELGAASEEGAANPQ